MFSRQRRRQPIGSWWDNGYLRHCFRRKINCLRFKMENYSLDVDYNILIKIWSLNWIPPALNGSISSRMVFGIARNCDEPISFDDQSSTFDISLVDLIYSFSFKFCILLSRIGCTLSQWQLTWCQFPARETDCNSDTLFKILHVSFRTVWVLRAVLWKSIVVHLHLHKILLFSALLLLQVVVVMVFWLVGLPSFSLLFNDCSLLRVPCFDSFVWFLEWWLVWLDADFSLPWLLVLAQHRLDDDWLCCTFNELVFGDFCLQFLWQWRHTVNLSIFFVTGLDRTVIWIKVKERNQTVFAKNPFCA